MSSITPPADDAGVQSLRQSNRTATGVASVSSVAAKPAIHQSPGTTTTDSLRIKRHRLVERRSENRRRQKQKVLLDTRSRHDRRTAERRTSVDKSSVDKNSVNKHSAEEEKRPQTRGVNIKV